VESPAAGAVVLVPFPFSDLSRAKFRPAVVLADAGRGDFILCQITSNPYADPGALELTNDSFTSGSLERTSYARPGKLFTAHESLIQGRAGVLRSEVLREICGRIVALLQHTPA
jgi:mRNA interferase MazF